MFCFQLMPGGQIREGNSFVHEAEFIHPHEVMCPLRQPTTKRAADGTSRLGLVYSITVTNDGTKYSSPVQLLAFNGKCLDCNRNMTCSLKVCLII